ncbi:MAG: hypothetical protein IJ640_00210 [Prevotella sp.]|nr:hypothetical protein [Prevotella sp.]
MKTYYLTLSQVFPSTHYKKGEPTYFKCKLYNAGVLISQPLEYDMPANSKEPNFKYHTIRANYGYWRKRFEKIDRGEACLSIRMWSGKPYRSKMIEIARLTKEDGIGLQKLMYSDDVDMVGEYSIVEDGWELFGIKGDTKVYNKQLAKNDGLSYEDWNAWFNNPNYDLSKPMAIIHFTKFRY